MSSRSADRRRSWREGLTLVAVIGPVVLIWLGQLVGGGGSPGWSAGLTAGLAVCGVAAVLWGGAFDGSGRRPLALSGWALFGLAALGVFTILPVSAGLQQGSWQSLISSPVLSVDPGATLTEVMKLGGLAAAFVGALAAARNRRRLRLALAVFLGLGLAWAAWAIVLHMSNPSTRLALPLVSPNIAAAVLAIVVSVGLTVIQVGGRVRLGRLLGFAVIAIPAAGVLLTASRSGIALTVLIIVLALVLPTVSSRVGGRLGIRAVLTWVGAGAVIFMAGDRLLGRLGQTASVALDRGLLVQIYGDAAAQAPWFGYGLGSAPALSRILLTPETYTTAWNVRAAHNVLVQWWLEGGVAGMLLAAAVLIPVSGFAIRHLDREGWRKLWPLVAVLGFAALQGMTDYGLQIYSVSLSYAWVLGLLFGVAAGRRRYWRAPARTRSPRSSLSVSG